ncbi:DUF2834 domain-containing protein [Cytobacillus sp. FJAT-54145]|uniref:DUF2834 domain-containing protein n=1 Tax=Cytobacillus spartinae TaxID=3299023 RepID=A0ABW6K6I6_9BACI
MKYDAKDRNKFPNVMLIPKALLVLVIVLFSILTGFSVYHHGVLGIFSQAFSNYASMQVFFDLFIALILVLVWMWCDAKKTNRSFWPWALITLTIGSFGPLLYLLLRKRS